MLPGCLLDLRPVVLRSKVELPAVLSGVAPRVSRALLL